MAEEDHDDDDADEDAEDAALLAYDPYEGLEEDLAELGLDHDGEDGEDMDAQMDEAVAEMLDAEYKPFETTCDHVKIRNMATRQFLSQRYLTVRNQAPSQPKQCFFGGVSEEELAQETRFKATGGAEGLQPMFASNEIFQVLKVEGEEDAVQIRGAGAGGMLLHSTQAEAKLGCKDYSEATDESTTSFVFSQGFHEETWLIEAVFGPLWDYSRYLSQHYSKNGEVESLISLEPLDEIRYYTELTDDKSYLWEVICADRLEEELLMNETASHEDIQNSENLMNSGETKHFMQ